MKKGNFAIYNGVEYSADYKDERDILLRSTNIMDIKNGFQPNNNKDSQYKCFKIVPRNDISELYNIVNKVEYKGHIGNILEEQGNRILIEIDNLLEDKAQALKMDYATDKGIYAKWVDKSDVKINTEKIKL